MKKDEVMSMFIKPKAKAPGNPRTYDVGITLPKSGYDHGRPKIRFGFLNKAAEVFQAMEYIEVTDVEKMKYKIYFRASETQEHSKMHKLSRSKSKKSISRYFEMNMTESAEKIYKAMWEGKKCKLEYDEECGLYFIENCQIEEGGM